MAVKGVTQCTLPGNHDPHGVHQHAKKNQRDQIIYQHMPVSYLPSLMYKYLIENPLPPVYSFPYN